MIPLRDHNPSQGTPWVTWALLALNIVVFLSYLPLFGDPRMLMAFFAQWGVVPAEVSGGVGLAGLVTSQFLHGGWLHLGFNMLFLWIFGDNMEEEWGHLPFLGFYLACGVAAALVQVLASPGSQVPMVGASGAIAGVLGGYVLLFPRARVDVLFIIVILFKIVPMPAWLMLGIWFGLQLVGGVVADAAAGGVAHWAHAGGFVAGVTLTLPLWLRRGGPAFWARTRGAPPHPEARYPLVRSHVPAAGRRRGPRPTMAVRGPWGRAQRPVKDPVEDPAPGADRPAAGRTIFPVIPRRRR
ncbi:MAG: rhomboid family intramembrane serine protease [Alkalilacustris sp.]